MSMAAGDPPRCAGATRYARGVSLSETRRRLPIVALLPAADNRRVVATPPGEQARPRLAVWELTLKCDQKCIHCGSRGGPARPGELDTAEALELVTQLRALGVGEVTLLGGEAYLRDDFILVIRAIREAGMACSLTTGGLNLSDERCAAMLAAGVSSVNLSIDGTEAAHDELRGVPGSWRRAFAALERLRVAGARRAVNTQINRLSLPTLEALQEDLLAAGIRAWQLQITAPFGNAADHPEILLQPYMYPQLFAALDRIVDRAHAEGMTIWPANNLGYFGPFEAKLRALQKRGGHYKGCGAGRTTIGIEADGAIKGCPSLGGPANVGGNLRVTPLAQIWAEAPQLRYTRERTIDDLWGYCRGCYYNDLCMGGCTATSEPLLGRPGNNPFCHHRALEMARAGLRERIELVQRAPGRPFDHGLYRVIRESADPERAAQDGPVAIEDPRSSRALHPYGPGEAVR
jgi:radical SAM protein with 4Fe4S-binding SPASM domain